MGIPFPSHRHFVLYGLIGFLSASIDFGLFSLLSYFTGMHYLWANCIGVIAGIVSSFFLNRQYNFKVKDKTVLRFIIFLTVGVLGLLLSNVLLFVFIEHLDMGNVTSKILSVGLVALFQFCLNSFLTFRKP